MLAMSTSPSSTSISTPRTVPSRVFSGPPSVRMSPARRLPGPSISMADAPGAKLRVVRVRGVHPTRDGLDVHDLCGRVAVPVAHTR